MSTEEQLATSFLRHSNLQKCFLSESFVCVRVRVCVRVCASECVCVCVFESVSVCESL